MKKLLIALLLNCLPGVFLSAQNLIKDSDVNKKPLSPEFRICEDTSTGTLTQFVEEYTWNHCLKLELKKYSAPKTDVVLMHWAFSWVAIKRRPVLRSSPTALIIFLLK